MTVPGVTSAIRAALRAALSAASGKSPVVTPPATTSLMVAVWPVSARSTSVKVTGIEVVRPAEVVGSVRSFWAIAAIAGASSVPVIVITTVCVSLPSRLSVAVIV